MHGNRPIRAGSALLLCLLLSGGGCRTPPVDQARNDFYAGRLAPAEQHLETIPENDKDEVLFLMERGMIRHALQAFDPSSDDWRRAAERNAWLETYSVSQGAASLVSNDRVLPFRGAPFEMTLLYSFLAKNYLARQNWDFAAISARNIIKLLEDRNGFPEVPYARYMAGFCLALINDTGNAATQYRAINEIFEQQLIDPETGRRPATGEKPLAAPQPHELVVFLAMGRMPTPQAAEYAADAMAPQIEIIIDEQHRDTALFFDNTAGLMAATRRRLAAKQLAKDISRIAVKETIAASVESQNDGLGQLLRLLLFALEAPDDRCWETLPRWLAVARLPCPADMESYTVVFQDHYGHHVTRTITGPIMRRGNLFISFFRDLP